ncbi:MAG: hypothetical protein ACFFB3_15500 [Candidatus Hodarchaeota archaeon]
MMFATADTSFFVNMHILRLLDLLCEVFDQILIPPSVWEESFELHSVLSKPACIEEAILTDEESREAEQLHKEFTNIYKGEHHGDVEALVMAVHCMIPLMVCDNFAPWYLQRTGKATLSHVKIARGFTAVERRLSDGLISSDVIERLEKTYPRKINERLRKQIPK